MVCRSCFFFSSRRRHTRYIGDWSSDVCSSDLDNIRLKAKRSPEFYAQVKPMLNVGGLMAYPRGEGGLLLCNLLFKDNEEVPEIGRASCRERVESSGAWEGVWEKG